MLELDVVIADCTKQYGFWVELPDIGF